MTRSPASPLARYSSGVGAVVLAGLAWFQLALALGAPWGRAAYGGAIERPTGRMRGSSAVASVVWAVVALVVLRRGGHAVPQVVPGRAVPVVMWIAIGLLAVGVVLNTITPSKLERIIWAPASLVMLVATTATELAARTHR